MKKVRCCGCRLFPSPADLQIDRSNPNSLSLASSEEIAIVIPGTVVAVVARVGDQLKVQWPIVKEESAAGDGEDLEAAVEGDGGSGGGRLAERDVGDGAAEEAYYLMEMRYIVVDCHRGRRRVCSSNAACWSCSIYQPLHVSPAGECSVASKLELQYYI